MKKTKSYLVDLKKTIEKGTIYIYLQDGLSLSDSFDFFKFEENKEADLKVKISPYLLNSYFTTDETLKNIQGQLKPNDKVEGDITNIEKVKSTLVSIISKGFNGLNLSYPEIKTMKGIFSLCHKQGASEEKPFVLLKNISQLYEEILEKKKTRTKGKYSFKDFRSTEVKIINKALESLENNRQPIIIRGFDGIDKKTKKPLFFIYMKKIPLISIEYFKRKIPQQEAEEITEKQLEETAQIKISILPIFLRGFYKYFKLLPKDISKEIREKCPDIKKPSNTMINFILLLYRQDRDGLINGNELRRTRETLIKELKLEKQSKKQGRIYIKNILLKCYETAKRMGYLEDYKTDQKGKTTELVDIFYLNIDRFDHLKQRQLEKKQR